MQNTFSTQTGAFTVAASLVLLAGVVAIQSHQALGLWQNQIKNEAIDGCAQQSMYSASRVREDVNGEYTATDNYPISWIFDECMRNKNAEYTRTDFSNVTEEKTSTESASDSAETK